MSNTEEEFRPEWLPEKFASPEALANSYRELEQRFTQMASEKRELETELEGLTFADVEYTEEDLSAIAAAEPYAQSVAVNINSSEPVQAAERIERATSNLDVMRLLAEAAQQAERKVDQTIGQSFGTVPQTPSLDATALAGLEQVRSTHPGWSQDTERMISEEIASNQAIADMVSHAVGSGDPANVATALYGAHAAVQTRQQTRAEANTEALTAMKVNAQSLTGSMGRPGRPSENEAEWDSIKAAKPNRYRA